MTPDELDRELRSVTDHEMLYRRGYVNPRSSSFPRITVDGREVMQFSYSIASAESNGIPFLVKRHSRFRDYPYHVHDWIELSYMYSGHSTQLIDGKGYELREGQLLLMAPDTVHTLEPLAEDDILVQIAIGQSNLTHNFFNRLSSMSLVSKFLINAFADSSRIDQFFLFSSEGSRRLRVFVTEFLCEWYNPSLSTYDIQNDLFSLIVSELVNVLYVTSGRTSSEPGNQYVLPALRHIEKNYVDCTLESVSSHLSLHPNYLSSLLKRYTGSSFNVLVQKERISAAERLLTNSEMSITEIASLVGYHNVSFFYRIFKRKNSCLPGEYRERHRGV